MEGHTMAFKIGFATEVSEKKNTETIPSAPKETIVPRKSVVQVHFPTRNMKLAYYNDQFDLHCGDLVYVDGKQSPLEGAQALQQVAASNIEDIEIITTPSARYRTEGDVGIINIITKRRDDAGVSGAVNLAGSTIGAWNADALVSHRKGANRFYVGAAFSENKESSCYRSFRRHSSCRWQICV